MQNALVKKCLSQQRSMLGTVAATASYAATVHRAGRVLVRIKRKKQEIQVVCGNQVPRLPMPACFPTDRPDIEPEPQSKTDMNVNPYADPCQPTNQPTKQTNNRVPTRTQVNFPQRRKSKSGKSSRAKGDSSNAVGASRLPLNATEALAQLLAMLPRLQVNYVIYLH